MKCTHCQTVLNENEQRCPICGAETCLTEEHNQKTEIPDYQPALIDEQKSFNKTNNNKNNLNYKRVLIIATVGIISILLILFFLNKSHTTSHFDETTTEDVSDFEITENTTEIITNNSSKINEEIVYLEKNIQENNQLIYSENNINIKLKTLKIYQPQGLNELIVSIGITKDLPDNCKVSFNDAFFDDLSCQAFWLDEKENELKLNFFHPNIKKPTDFSAIKLSFTTKDAETNETSQTFDVKININELE